MDYWSERWEKKDEEIRSYNPLFGWLFSNIALVVLTKGSEDRIWEKKRFEDLFNFVARKFTLLDLMLNYIWWWGSSSSECGVPLNCYCYHEVFQSVLFSYTPDRYKKTNFVTAKYISEYSLCGHVCICEYMDESVRTHVCLCLCASVCLCMCAYIFIFPTHLSHAGYDTKKLFKQCKIGFNLSFFWTSFPYQG